MTDHTSMRRKLEAIDLAIEVQQELIEEIIRHATPGTIPSTRPLDDKLTDAVFVLDRLREYQSETSKIGKVSA